MIGKLLQKTILLARQALLRKGLIFLIRSFRRTKRILRRKFKHLQRGVQRWAKIAHRQYGVWRDMQRFSREPRAAKNPETMRNILQSSLPPLGGKTYQIQQCQVHSIRHKRAEH